MLPLTERAIELAVHQPKTIVLVDDSPELGRLYQQILELEGYQVFFAASGPKALELLDTISSPDLLLVDGLMPGMSGSDFLKELKIRNPKIFETCPIVGFSGLTTGSILLQEMTPMVSRMVEKPNDIEDVLKLVEETIRR